MKQERISLWKNSEYSYSQAFSFLPFMMGYLHEDCVCRPCMVVVPGGGYLLVSPTEGELVAKEFYEKGYQVFVLVYTTDFLMREPLQKRPLADLSRAVRLIRRNAGAFHIDPEKLTVCGFSAGAHLCGLLCVHSEDIVDPDETYRAVSNRPDAAILGYPVITAGKGAHRGSVLTLLGRDASQKELDYISLENHVTRRTPPCFIWQTAEDRTVKVDNSFLFAEALKNAKVPYTYHVFSRGPHGLSVANEAWLSRDYGGLYTLEQTKLLLEAIKTERITDIPDGMAETIEKQIDFSKGSQPTQRPEERAFLKKVIREVGIWPALAQIWLENILNLG